MSDIHSITTKGEILVETVSHRQNCVLETISDYYNSNPSDALAIFPDQTARMGEGTEMIGGVGADGFGRSILQRLQDDVGFVACRSETC